MTDVLPDDTLARETYEIPEPNFAAFKVTIEALAKRATRLKLAPVGFQEVDTFLRSMKDGAEGSQGRSVRVRRVEVFGARPVVAGWRFCGKLEHIPETDDVLVKELNEGDVPVHYRTCEANCDHCKTDRNRRDTFVIRHIKTGEYKQIGRSCLGDFFGGMAPEAVARMFELVQECRDAFRDFEDYDEDRDLSPKSMYYAPVEILALSACAIREGGGYISAREADALMRMSTGQLVRTNLTVSAKKLSADERLTVIDVDRRKAGDVLAWLQSASLAAMNDTYFYNLRTLAHTAGVGYRNIGLFASAVVAYDREQSRSLEKDAAVVSQYVGTVGEKIELVVTLTGTSLIPGFQYGDKLLHRFLDTDGNALVWFCSGHSEMMPGERYHIKGTVKKQEIYREVQQTTLERVTCPDMRLFDWIKNYDGDLKAFMKKLKTVSDVNVRESSDGRTPIYEALMYDQVELVRILLNAGAMLDRRDKHGYSPEDIRPEIVGPLRNEGYAEGWLVPDPALSYGRVTCEATNLELLKSLGAQVAPYDALLGSVLVEVSPAAADQLKQFPADFVGTWHPYREDDQAALDAFCDYHRATSPTPDIAKLWDIRIEALSKRNAPVAPTVVAVRVPIEESLSA